MNNYPNHSADNNILFPPLPLEAWKETKETLHLYLQWVEQLVPLYRDYRQDTFVFWPVAGNQLVQIEAFTREVAPAVRAEIEKLRI